MVESAPGEEPRVAEAVARLLSRQATLLARSSDDEVAAGAARLGLSWLADLLRSFGLHGASDWFQALRVRADVLGHRTSAAWAALAAPLCEVLAAEVRRAESLAPLADGAHDWPARVAELSAFPEPAPAVAPPPPVAPPPVAPPPVAPPPVAPPAPPVHEDARTPLFEAIADLAGETQPTVDADHGRIEIAGTLPRRSDAEVHGALTALDSAARAVGAAVVTTVQDNVLRWSVRLPLAPAEHYLFVESVGTALAVPWSRVVEYGPAPDGAHARVVLGNGLERTELAIDWLVAQGAGTRLPDEPATDAGVAVPRGFALAGRVRDAEGRAARVVDLAPQAPEAPVPPAAQPPLPAALPAPPAAHIVQPEAVPADNLPETPPSARPALRALVADDSMMARVFLARLLAQRGFSVDEAEDGAEALGALASGHYDIAFLDAEMPGAGAIQILRDAGALLTGRVCVLVKDEDERRRVESLGHVPVLFKPFAEDEVRAAVEALLTALPRAD